MTEFSGDRIHKTIWSQEGKGYSVRPQATQAVEYVHNTTLTEMASPSGLSHVWVWECQRLFLAH
ncbi:hypothetical protein M7I_6845 [Glarea lozoyensis 74030]|uniref:Uncharacterized protein n=1 Tax=Glarea lozoyensis (strain ATCC 74030 / MF5533) TaxID=1104152 RepID=H0EVP4_GLAL7|nr:hypothetical protein M7I_6845 [Glarea lozoyensis 74030]